MKTFIFHVLVMPASCLGTYFSKVWSTLPTKGVWTQIITYSHFAISTESLWVPQKDSDFQHFPRWPLRPKDGCYSGGSPVFLKKLNQRCSQVPWSTPRRRLLKSDGEAVYQRSKIAISESFQRAFTKVSNMRASLWRNPGLYEALPGDKRKCLCGYFVGWRQGILVCEDHIL